MPIEQDLGVPVTTPATVAQEPEQEVEQGEPGAPQVAETDEQKNAAALKAQEDRQERRRQGTQRRFDELTAEKYAERARADAAERELAEMRRFMTSQPRPAGASEGEPQRDDPRFGGDYEKYLEARADWRAQKAADDRIKAAEDQARQRAQIEQANRAAQTLQRDLAAKQRAYADKVPDFYDVVNTEDVRLPDAAAFAVMAHKDAAALMYHLAKNPEAVDPLWNLHPMQQAAAIGEIAAKLNVSAQVSTAPPPIKPVGSKSGNTNKDPADMDYDEFVKFRRRQIAQRR